MAETPSAVPAPARLDETWTDGRAMTFHRTSCGTFGQSFSSSARLNTCARFIARPSLYAESSSPNSEDAVIRYLGIATLNSRTVALRTRPAWLYGSVAIQ